MKFEYNPVPNKAVFGEKFRFKTKRRGYSPRRDAGNDCL